MRIELWNLFREDVRDVFECTRANMDNYMVVGTLIIASVRGRFVIGGTGRSSIDLELHLWAQKMVEMYTPEI